MNRPYGATVLSRPIKFSDGVDRGLFAHRESIGCLRREREEREKGLPALGQPRMTTK